MYDDGYSIDPPRQGQGPRAQSLIDRARQTGGAIHETAWLNALSMARFFWVGWISCFDSYDSSICSIMYDSDSYYESKIVWIMCII